MNIGLAEQNCPDAYAGWFFEWEAGWAYAGVSDEIGIFTAPGQTVAGGGYFGSGGLPAEAKLCYYRILDDPVESCGCR